MFYSFIFLLGILFGGEGVLLGDAYCIKEGKIEDLIPIKEKGKSTPDTLIMPAGIYAFNGPCYDCTKEGLYRFYTVGSIAEQRLVFSGDIDRLMESISWLVEHGFKDDNHDFSTALQIVKKRKLRMTCGSIANFSIDLLSLLGVTSRFVLFLTLHPWNHYNNGHSIIEVLDAGKWTAWDIDFRNRFESDGQRLTAWEFKNLVSCDDYDVVKFSRSPLLASGSLVSSGYDYGFHYERHFLFEDKLRNQYKKCAQVVLIREKGVFYFTCDPSVKARVESYDKNFVFLEEEEFIKTFYSEVGMKDAFQDFP